MKKISINKLLKCIGILCCMAILPSMTSCSSVEKEPEPVINLLPVQRSMEGPWSMIDNKGNIVYDDMFEKAPTMAINGFFSVYKNKSYTLCKIGDKAPEVVNGCENLKSIGIMRDGLIPIVRYGKRIEIINEAGETQFELSPVDGVEIQECEKIYKNGLLCVMTKEHRYGFVDKKGNYVIPCTYGYAWGFENGYALVGEIKEEDPMYNIWYVIDTSGDKVFDLGESIFRPNMFCGYIKTEEDDHYVLTDMDGDKHELPSSMHELYDIQNDLIIYADESKKKGLANLAGDIFITPQYEDLRFAFNGDLIARKESDSPKTLILDTTGKVKQTLDFEYFFVIHGFSYIGSKNNIHVILDNNFKKVGKDEFFNEYPVDCTGFIRSDYKGY